METATGYHSKICEVAKELVDHGFGKMEFIVIAQSDDKVKIIINAGKSWVYFIQKEINLKDTII